ncbi:ArsR/SmtB family transcription factor [Litorimonas sp. RW-G-Af-16]|uniref:ArsR/SmtB family transcription factor n=1 Tax=Litorimonas sp. RW-G-Af-16 TaxID=3241168 RepID=UPI00390C9B29
MEQFALALKTLGHTDRLRILALLSQGELTVSELVQILGLSQPRVTQYIKSLEGAGLIERLREGSWVFSRLRRNNVALSALVATTLATLPQDDPTLAADRKRLEDVRQERSKLAEAFFAEVANDRSQLGNEYLPQADIERAILNAAGEGPFELIVDLGTGTGRMLELFADRVARGVGVDSSSDMLKIARHALLSDETRHLQVRQGDLHATPIAAHSANLVTMHQVLHYLDDPQEAVHEAARLLDDNGAMLIIDFTAHQEESFRANYAHRRLGFSDSEIAQLFEEAGLTLDGVKTIESRGANIPAVKIWKGIKTASQNDRNIA